MKRLRSALAALAALATLSACVIRVELAPRDASPACMPLTETCNNVDDDCDGIIDNGAVCADAAPMPMDLGVATDAVDTTPPPPPDAADASPPDTGMCRSGHVDCNGDVSDGCEVEILSNPAHCGGCGNVCAATMACRDGVCVVDPACMPGTEVCNGRDDDCDGMVDEMLGRTSCGTGACLRTVDNCVMGVPQACTAGMPGTESCNGLDDDCDGAIDESTMCPDAGTMMCMPGLADCDGNVMNGCEIDLRSSTFNCGACGVSCTPGTACRDGVCG